MENLRSFLSTLNPDEPHYLGYVLKPYLKNGYNAGGAGYILSRAALKIFSEQLYSNATLCPDDIYEDVGIARLVILNFQVDICWLKLKITFACLEKFVSHRLYPAHKMVLTDNQNTNVKN